MSVRRSPRRLLRERDGATIVEFGIVLLPLTALFVATLELGYATYVKAMVQGALQDASRDAALGNRTPAEIDAQIRSTLGPLVSSPTYDNCAAAPAGQVPLVCSTIRSYEDFSRVGKPEKLIDDKNNNGKYDAGDCYEDANDNKTYDNETNSGRASGGNADDAIAYTIRVVYRRIAPVDRFFGWSANNTIESTTMLRNQPFAKPVQVVTRCN